MQLRPQTYGQQSNSQLIGYLSQPSIVGQPIGQSRLSLQSPQLYSLAEEPAKSQLFAQFDQTERQAQGIQGVQQIHGNAREQDLRVNPLTVNQRSHVVPQTGLKNAVNV